jgi:hypothetical protein
MSFLSFSSPVPTVRLSYVNTRNINPSYFGPSFSLFFRAVDMIAEK